MKKIPLTKIWVAIGITCLSILLITGMLTAIWVKGLASADAAGWVQALGSMAAIVAALYVWIGDREERRKDEKAIALVASVSMSHSATVCRDELDACASLLAKAGTMAYPIETSHHIRRRLASLPVWSVEEIHRLSALGNCALNLARAQHTAHAARRLLNGTLDHKSSSNLRFMSENMEKVVDLLNGAKWNLDEALGSMVDAGKPTALAGLDVAENSTGQ